MRGLKGNPVGIVLGILLLLAVGYILVSLLMENAALREEVQQSDSLVQSLTTQNRGPAGEDGQSAYELWLEQGNSGSEQDFLDSLKGEPGQATNGVDGRDGTNGAAGSPGRSVGSVVCVGGTKLNFYDLSGVLISSVKAVCIP